ncbi:MAG: AAA family ATPase [Sphingomonas sp.]|uniref:AAA family ATPase n=1 Tax=Sphingomonas sp. TaxID=28214 RepID=UPI0022762A08|nr:AAA family ATPase [Sphingomonas sp.]MCX8477649.1 AAA family ATPase [Sphingomonas sp.]
MRLRAARVQNYRSIRDTGLFDVERDKTILVGPNEAGKTAVLQALQQVNAPKGIKGFDALRDYPRALYNDITTGAVKEEDVAVATAIFELDDEERASLPADLRQVRYQFTRMMNNNPQHTLLDAPALPTFGTITKDLSRLAAHIDKRTAVAEGQLASTAQTDKIAALTGGWRDFYTLSSSRTKELRAWLKSAVTLIEDANEAEEARLDRLNEAVNKGVERDEALSYLNGRLPVFVLFSNYFRVRPLIHLSHLAQRLATNILDDTQYDYGNSCLLKLLGFTAQELSALGSVSEPAANHPDQLQRSRDQLDKRSYQLNAASVRLTKEIREVWQPSSTRPEADRLRVVADGQYLKVVVEDDLGVEVELDQRSEGFQWLVSFFVVFFAEAMDRHENAILLLDEPGMSLHALKQRDFRNTLSRLSEKNQTIYTTHSPFLVGPNELDLVRVVELNDRTEGTKVHTTITSTDPAALLPLQEALGYDLAQSLFATHRNLILEGLTDAWYVEAVAALLKEEGSVSLNDKIALITASSAGKVVYFATILTAHNLKVAALLDSDAAGENAASQDTLVHSLGAKSILRTKDYIEGVSKPEIEDLLRTTLSVIAREVLGIDVVDQAASRPQQPLVDMLGRADKTFSKYKLAKAFLRWSRDHNASDLTEGERTSWIKLIGNINAALK